MATREDIDALVIDLGGTPSSENSTWMGNSIGNVVRVWASANQTGKRYQQLAIVVQIETYSSLLRIGRRALRPRPATHVALLQGT